MRSVLHRHETPRCLEPDDTLNSQVPTSSFPARPHCGHLFPSGTKVFARSHRLKPGARQQFPAISLPWMKNDAAQCQMALIIVRTEVPVLRVVVETVVPIAVARFESQSRSGPLPYNLCTLADPNVLIGVVLPGPAGRPASAPASSLRRLPTPWAVSLCSVASAVGMIGTREKPAPSSKC